jgi:type II secretory pathway pseudopilin PulG
MNRSTVAKSLAVAASAVVVAALAGALAVLGWPAQQRQRALDDRRLRDLQDIVEVVQGYAKKRNALPQDLPPLKEENSWRNFWTGDPDTREPYEYKALDDQSFQLCAVFSLPSSASDDHTYYGRWRRTHAAGKQCFTYTRDDDVNTGCRR